MDVPVLVQVTKGENIIYEKIGNEVDNDNLKALRKSAEIVQKNLNSYLTKLVEEERKTQPNEKSKATKDESSESDFSDEEQDEDVDNLLKTISAKKC
ncbi:uncharacterized protein LOC122505572 isoform X2 [Leptopilina heterotoma]|nr:uncharacterized protein LOC122505572 isoform X2 [Leptopilina heterotoma]